MNAVLAEPYEIERSELLKLCAVDDVFYCRHFFPKTFRQESPDWHRDFWFHFNDPEKDLFAAEIFRGGGKSTLTRAGISKRIAFAISRNLLSIAINETMATHTVRWIRKHIEIQSYWARFFQLQKAPGGMWSNDWIEIWHGIYGHSISLMAKGITSGIRGLNVDDWRPDFIFCDDISNEETVGTEDQRVKNSELFFGTIVPALAPKSEAPTRKLVLAQTGLHKEDIVYKAHDDPSFYTVKYPKLVYDKITMEPLSAWPQRWSLDEVLLEKEQYTRRNQYHIWLREFGTKIISRETAPLNADWLKYYTVLPTNLIYFTGLDPATDSPRKKAHRTAGGTIGFDRQTGDVYLVSYQAQQGKNPDEMWTWLWNQWRTFRPRKVGVETVAFQKVLAWYFKKKMEESKTFFVIEEIQDRRPKPDRIIQAFSGIASQGRFYISKNHTEFIQGFSEWTEGTDWDLGDAIAQAITLCLGLAMSSMDMQDLEDYIQDEENDIPALVYQGGAP